ncbi:MAG TPA: anthranilate phosphoribosyltransferase [Victivallales bacterium]|nr:anthranilate phosphoribosyltransferase [Victivallales bacterium]
MKNAFDVSLQKLVEKKDLSYQESFDAMSVIMSGGAPAASLATWLTLMKSKGENSNEIGGCAAAMRAKSVKISCNDPNAVDTCGTGGDGCGTFNISTAAAIIASGAGITVAKHGNRAVSGKSGSADVLEKLGVNISISPEKAEKCLNSIGIAFLFAPNFHPAMKYAAPVRKELGFRTIFNILGPLCSPASVRKAIIGVYSEDLCRLVADAALKIGYEKALVLHSDDGLDEISLCSTTLICEIRNGQIIEYEFEPTHHGFNLCSRDDISGGNAEENAKIIQEILDPKKDDSPRRQIAVLNAAAAIFASKNSDKWDEAISLARRSINSGAASAKLDELRKFSSN